MKIKIDALVVCTAGKDRSPEIAAALRYRGCTAMSCGISKWHTGRSEALHVIEALEKYEPRYILCVEAVQEAYINGVFDGRGLNARDQIISGASIGEIDRLEEIIRRGNRS